MQFLKFVAYVFEYQGGKKYENSGYAKVEFQQERIKMILQLRLPGIVNERLKIHLFTEKNGQMAGFLAGEGKLKWNALQMQILIGKDKLEEYQLSFRDLKGIYIISESGQEFISEWEDHSFPGREFRLLEPKMIRKEAERINQSQQMEAGVQTDVKEIADQADHFNEVKEEQYESRAENDKAREFKAQTREGVEKEEENIEADNKTISEFLEHEQDIEEILEEDRGREISAALDQGEQAIEQKSDKEEAMPTVARTEETTAELEESEQNKASAESEETSANLQWDAQNINEKEPHVKAATLSQQEIGEKEKKQTDFVKIDLRALRQLPRKEWHLASNRFLLHGFYNYRYLCMRQEDDNTIILGVPGVYYVKEKAAAAQFGFAYFECQHMRQPVEGEFGFWCRKIRV